jgi:hypothetical protein
MRTKAIAFACSIAASVANAQIVLYEHDNFNGRTYRASYSVQNLDDSGFNDKASSVTVRGGKWQLCVDAYFRGSCVTLGPGEYPSLRAMGMNDKVSSARELGWTPDGGGGWSGNHSYNSDSGYNNRYTNHNNNYQGANWGSGSRAVLFAGFNLSGEAFVVESGGVNNLDRTGFNDKARSLRVESGYWLFCTDANFQGECRTYGPGDYPSLSGGQSRSISSGRQVSNNYPYRSNPNWSGN